MKTTPANRLVFAVILLLMALGMVYSPYAEAQVVRVPAIQITPTPSGMAVTGAGIGRSSFEGIGIRPTPAGGLEIGGFSRGSVIKRYESPKVEFTGPVIVVPPPPPKHEFHPPHGHPHQEWEQYCWTDSTQRNNPRTHCTTVPKR